MGVGLGGQGSMFFDPSWFGGASNPYWASSPVGQTIMEQSIPTGYYAFLRSLGIPQDNSAFSRWADQQLTPYTLGYNSWTASNPLQANLGDYNAQLGGYDAFKRQFLKMDPSLRGEDPSSRGAGPVRWITG